MTLLTILSTQEKKLFDLPPVFDNDERVIYFSLTPPIKRYISRMENNAMKAGFLLQLAYFRANARFCPAEKYRPRDLKHVRGLLQLEEFTLNRYDSKSSSKHRKKILSLLDWTPCGASEKALLTNYALRQASNQVKPRQLFIGMVDLCWKHRFSIPSYFDICEIVTNCFNQTEEGLLNELEDQLNDQQRQSLEAMLSPGPKKGVRSQPAITELKKINQGLKPSEIQESIKTSLIFKDLFAGHEETFNALPLNDQATEYYATWFQKADYQQLTQFPSRHKAYLHLLSFVKHQHYKRQDALVEVLKKSVTSIRHSVNAKLLDQEHATKRERNEALQLLNNAHKSMREFARSVISIVESTSSTPNEKYYKIEELVNELESLTTEDEDKLENIDDYLSNEKRNQTYYDILEAHSLKLQRRVSGILSILEFDRVSSSSALLEAIDYFCATGGKIKVNAPTDFLKNAEIDVLYREDKIIVPLYKCFLFFHITDGIKSGDLNLLHSYEYRAIQDYLIDSDYWRENKDTILRETGMQKFSDGNTYLAELKSILDKKYRQVNERIINNENTYVRIDGFERPIVKTPGIELNNKEFISSTLSKEGYTPILKVLKEVNAATYFTKGLTHFSTKNVKMKPNEETLLAGIIGKGCNIGISKLAKISTGLSEHVLHNAVTWCLDLKNISEVNQRILDAIHSLELANNYIKNTSTLHSSSDGRKVNVAVDSLHANYSFKYFGKDKGVTMYTFIDERQSLFHSTVFSSSDREAAYVIDGLVQNNVAPNQIHSTDTHGYTEQIFAATHFIGVDFAPRFKNLAGQRIFGFSAKQTYQKKGYHLLPSRSIDRKQILKNWDDILRFMATIKTNHTTASQLFKRLSSYASSHPLYRALQEFGRIIKSKFILTYYDDLELRQQIQKMLNRIELANKFAHAVFFDNDQAFQDGATDEQALATACQVVLQNSIILWNYMYLSTLILGTKNKAQKLSIIEAIGQGSVITWTHINLRGEYNFTKRSANDPQFDFKKIKALRL